MDLDIPGVFIHPKAVVDESCEIGEGTKIWQFASLSRGVVLGKRCNVWPGVVLDGSVYGDDVKICTGFTAGAGFKVGNRVFIGPNVTFCNDVFPFVHRDGYDDETLRGNKRFTIEIGDDVMIGAAAVILPGIKIGCGSVIGAGCIVDRSLGCGLMLTANGYTRSVPTNMITKRMRWLDEGAENGA